MHNPTRRLVFIAILAGGAFARAQGASLQGIVVDPSGAAMPAVTITVRERATAAQRTAATSGDGSYLFANLAAGSYSILIKQPGFQPFERSAVELAGDTVRLDITLQLDHRNEFVTVSAEGAAPDPSETQSGETLSGATTRSMPLNGRSFTDLLSLQPGVIPASSQQPNAVLMAGVTSTPPSGGLNPGNMSVSGQRETANGFIVNGSDVEETVNMGTAVVPNLDSIAELRVLTSNFNAEYGNYSGGQILVVTKSGADDFHGDAFEFLRNTTLDARNFFSAGRARFDQNQYGATLGGPVRRERVFFFADYQGTRMTEGVDTGLIRVPSAADRTGDLQDLAHQLTGAVDGAYWAGLLSQRLGYAVSPNEPYYTPGCTDAAACVFPGAVIPPRAWSAPARSLLAYIPQPNAGADQFSTAAYDQTLGDNKGAVRLDGNSRWGMLSAYYFADHYTLDNPYPTAQGGASVPGFNAINTGLAQLASLSATKTFGANTVNEFHLSFMRNANIAGQPVGGVGPSLRSQGFVEGAGTPGIAPLAPAIEGIANVSFNDFTLGVDTTGLRQLNNTFQWSDNWSRASGSHHFKFGAAMHYDQVNTHPDAQSNGSFDFLGSETGVDFADFLLGIPSSYTQADSQSFYNRNHYTGAYGQDSWRARPNLTLNYGVRWDVIAPWSEKYNQLQTLVLGEQSVVYPGAPTGLVFPGDPGIPSTLAPTRYGSLAPRIGLAWGAGAKTTVRAGYGMFYTAFEGLSAGIMSANPPYGYSYTSPAPPLFQTPFITAATGQNTGQRFPLPFPPFGASAQNPDSSVNWAAYLPLTGIPSFYRQNVPPYAENFTVSLERELAASTFLRMGYVGAQAHHLLVVEEANPGNAALCLSLSQPAEVMPGTGTCGPFGESGVYTTLAGQTIQGTRGPFPAAFGGISYQKTIGNSNYNALEIAVRRHAGPLELLAGYTYSKSIDQSSSLAEAVNPLNPSRDRAPSAFDLTHNFVASYRYAIRGGFEISGITRFSTGFPVTLFNNDDTSLLGTIPNGINNNGVDTPNYTPGPLGLNRNPRSGEPAFNTALFSLPGLGQTGTAARRSFYGPGIANFDVALAKNIRLAESRTLQLRVEAFNVWNHAQFDGAAAVDGNIGSSNFGQITSAAAPRLVQLAAKFNF
jgi:hypothetical protein